MVQFLLDGVEYGNPVTPVGGMAALRLTSLPVGNHPVSAVYNGAPNHPTGGTAAQVTQEVAITFSFCHCCSTSERPGGFALRNPPYSICINGGYMYRMKKL